MGYDGPAMGVTQSLLPRFASLNAVSIWFLPIYVLYRVGWWIHFAWKKLAGPPPAETRAKVISIGGVEWGGSAKTSLAIEVARYLTGKGRRVAVLSRGFRRSTSGVQRVNAAWPDAARRYGDEPVLISREVLPAAVWVCADRAEAARSAEAAESPDAIILDDGLNVTNLRKDLEIVALDPEAFRPPVWLRDLYLRTPLRRAAQARIKIWLAPPASSPALNKSRKGAAEGDSLAGFSQRGTRPPDEESCLRAAYRLQRIADLSTGLPVAADVLRGTPVLAFCGIARPERFVETLRAAGLSVSEWVRFPDHHPYQAADIRRLLATAKRADIRTLLTTAKDAVRLEPLLNLFRGGASVDPCRFLVAHAELDWKPGRGVLEAELDSLWKS